MTNVINDIPSSVYADMYFAEEEEMKAGVHPSQIIPKMLETLRKNHISENYSFLDWEKHAMRNIVVVQYENNSYVWYDYKADTIIAKGRKVN